MPAAAGKAARANEHDDRPGILQVIYRYMAESDGDEVPTHEAHVDVATQLHAIRQRTCRASHHEEQQRYLDIIMAKNLWGKAASKPPEEAIAVQQSLRAHMAENVPSVQEYMAP